MNANNVGKVNVFLFYWCVLLVVVSSNKQKKKNLKFKSLMLIIMTLLGWSQSKQI